MAGIKKILDGDTVELDDGRVIRMTGVDTPESAIPDLTRPNKVGGWASAYYLKRWIGSTLTPTITVDQNSLPLSDARDGRDVYGRFLRRLTVSGTVIEEDLLSEGLASLYDFRGSLQKLDNKPALEAAAVTGATKVLFNATYQAGYDRTLPPRFLYKPADSYYRRIYVDMSDGADAEIQTLIANPGVVTPDDLVYTITEVGSLSSVSTGRASVPHPDSPVCETLIVLSGTASATTGYRWGPDSAAIDSFVTVGSDVGAMSGSELAVSEKVFCGITLEFLPGSTDLADLTAFLAKEEPDPASIEEWLKDYYERDRQLPIQLPERMEAAVLTPSPRRDRASLTRLDDWLPRKRRLAVRPDDRIYYGGVNCQIFVNNEYLDEANFMTHTIDISRKPFHSVNGVHATFFSQGKRYITGAVRFSLVSPEMLLRTVQRLTKGNTLSPKKLMQMRQRYRTGTLGNGLNEAIEQMRSFYAERLGGTPEEPARRLAGYLNSVRADTMMVLVGADDIPLAVDQPMFVLTYRDVVFTDFSTAVTADSRLIEGQASFIARTYEESVYGEPEVEPDYEFARIAVPDAVPIPADVFDDLAVGLAGAVPIQRLPVSPIELPPGEYEIANATDTIPTEDASQADAAVEEPDTVPDTLTAERFIKVVRTIPNNAKWHLDKTNISNLLSNFADWIDVDCPLAKMFREPDFDQLRSTTDPTEPSEDLIFFYACLLGLAYAEGAALNKFNIEEKGIAIPDWTADYVAVFDALNSHATQPDALINAAAGTTQDRLNMEIRRARAVFNQYGYAFPESPGDSPMSGATRTTALTQFLADANARGPFQALGLYYMTENARYAQDYQFYRTYVTDADPDWFVNPGTPGITDVSLWGDYDAMMAMNLAIVIQNMRTADNLAGSQSLVMVTNDSAQIHIDYEVLACAPQWHRWGPGTMKGSAFSSRGGVSWADKVLQLYDSNASNRDYFKMYWSVLTDVYRDTTKYDDAGNVDAGGTTLHDRIKAAITVS